MGYYSVIELRVSVKPDMIEELRKKLDFFKEVSDGGNADLPPRPDFLSLEDYGFKEEVMWELGMLCIDEQGDLWVDEPYQKWYEDSTWSKWLVPYLQEGHIEFCGEDGARSGYDYDGQGGIYALEYEVKRGRKLN